MIYESFTFEQFFLVLALYSYSGDKRKKLQSSFKSLVSKSVGTWWLERPQGINKLL